MLVELSPMLLSTLERVNTGFRAVLLEEDELKRKHLQEDYGRERSMLLLLLNKAVDDAETR